MARRTQVQRIEYFEGLYDGICEKVRTLNEAIEAFRAAEPAVNELEQYYSGRLWRKDLADDEAGKLPKDLKRGILSEDAVYDLLTEVDSIKRALAVLEEED